MMQYVVTMVKRRILRQREWYDRERGYQSIATVHQYTEFEVEDSDGNDWLDLQTFFFDHKRDADAFALYLATERPGYEVWVAKVENIVAAEISEPIIKQVTDKGVMPA